MSVPEPQEPYNSTSVHWFGRPWPAENWRAPVCSDDRYQIPTPTGVRCCLCAEAIEAGDRGVRYSGSVVMGEDGPEAGPIPYAHAECQLMSVMGNMRHQRGECSHVGDCVRDNPLTYREQALEVWAETAQ
jgi:hypothetical protein